MYNSEYRLLLGRFNIDAFKGFARAAIGANMRFVIDP